MKLLLNKFKNLNWYFLLSFLSIFVYIFFKYPTLSYHSELWAEQGTNYLYHAINSSFMVNLLATDAGYLVLIPRLIAYFAVKIFPIYYFPYLTNLFGLIFVSFTISFINSCKFRSLISSDCYRFVISLILGYFLLPYHENLTYVNFSYHGLLLCSLLLFFPVNKLKFSLRIALSLFIALLCLNKFHYVIFFPIYFVITITGVRKKRPNSLFYLPSLVAFVIQILNILSISASDSMIQGRLHTSLPQYLSNELDAIGAYIQSFLPASPSYCALIVWCIIFVRTMYLYRYSLITKSQFYFLLLLNYLAISFVCISALAHDIPNFNLLEINRMARNRTEFITIYCSFFCICVWIFYNVGLIVTRKKHQLVISVCCVCFIAGEFVSLATTESGNYGELDGQSEWSSYSSQFKNQSYFIPVDPFLPNHIWFLSKNVRIVDNSFSSTGQTIVFPQGVKDLFGVIVDSASLITEVKAFDCKGSYVGEGTVLTKERRYRKLVLFSKLNNLEICSLRFRGTSDLTDFKVYPLCHSNNGEMSGAVQIK